MKLILLLCVGWLWSASFVLAVDERLIIETTVSSDTETAYDVEWSPDGELLAVEGGYVTTIYDSALKPVSLSQGGPGVNLAWSPDGDQLVTVEGFRARRIRFWGWNPAEQTLSEAEPLTTRQDEYVVSWSPDGKLLATLFDDRGQQDVVTIWDLETRRSQKIAHLPYTEPLRVLEWQNEHLRGAGKNADGTLMLYEIDPTSGTATDLQPLPENTLLFDFSPDDSHLATVTDAGEAVISAGSQTLLSWQTVSQPVNISFSPDGLKLAVLSYQRQLQIWDVSDLAD